MGSRSLASLKIISRFQEERNYTATLFQGMPQDVRLDPMLELVKSGAQRQVVLQGLKGRFDFNQLEVELP
jgi:hypothetical protein